MGIFEDLYIKMRDVIYKVGDKTGKLLNISKIKIEMAEKKNLIFEKYKLIGKYVYDMYNNDEKFEFEDIMDWLGEIKNLKLSMKECERRLHRAQDKLFCSYCNYKNESDAIFCGKCGKKISFSGSADSKQEKNNNSESPESTEQSSKNCNGLE